MSGTVTVYDVAAHAGVSIATVSRVLRRPDDVRESTRERVRASVSALGYLPSAAARGLAARRTGVLGLYLPGFDAIDDLPEMSVGSEGGVSVVDDRMPQERPRLDGLYFDNVLRGAELEAWRRDFVLMVGVGRGHSSVEAVRDMAGRVDGLLVPGQAVPDDLLRQLWRRIPIVLLAATPAEDEYDHVSVSNTEGMQALTRHLIENRGVRRLLYVAGPEDSPDDAERHAGFRAAVENADVVVDPLIRGGFTRASGREVGERLVAAGDLPRAIVCGNDQMALGVLSVLAEAGFAVPDDVIVTGFDGIDASATSTPPLTTVRQPMVSVGRAAIRLMQRRLDNPDAEPLSERLPVDVLLRESSEGPA